MIFITGLEGSYHVYEEKGAVYNAVMELVDIAKGTNSYYKLQLLEGDTSKNYCVFRAWGRVGTSVGNSKVEVGAILAPNAMQLEVLIQSVILCVCIVSTGQ